MSRDKSVQNWWLAGLALVVASWVLLVLAQAVTGDWLPPEISFSQYGVGTNGWIFSLYLICQSVGPMCLDRAVPTGRVTRVLLVAGTLGSLVMAVVRTDPGGLQHSASAKVHMVASVVGLVGVPIGTTVAALRSGRTPRFLPWTFVMISAASLVLLVISATGVDTLGVGATTSWAYWQTCAVLADTVLTVLMLQTTRRTIRQSGHGWSAEGGPRIHRCDSNPPEHLALAATSAPPDDAPGEPAVDGVAARRGFTPTTAPTEQGKP
ncbi:MAG: DUF998 domain-containing protein [Nakamurella sp.]